MTGRISSSMCPVMDRCEICNGLLYKDDDIHTCRSCGRHVYPLGYVIGDTYGPRGKRISHGGR